MRKTIITSGYMGSGSSAVTDLISEYKEFRNDYGSYEYVMLHCPDGLFDLEDKLLYGNNAIRSDEALRSFRFRMHELYDKKFWWVGNYKDIIDPAFMKCTEEFLAEIEQFTFPGYWYMNENPNINMIMRLILKKPLKLLFHKVHKFKKVTRYDNLMHISYVNKATFYNAASNYVDKIINLIAKDSNNVVIDQFLLPFNAYRLPNYFDNDTYMIIVDRDPRDVFILNKYTWLKKDVSVPMPLDAKEFCAFYRSMRESEHIKDTKNVLRIHFEDLIYKYDETILKIESHCFLNEEDHIRKLKRFNPDISIKNTQLFHDERYHEESLLIERELAEYLYPFSNVINNKVENSIEF